MAKKHMPKKPCECQWLKQPFHNNILNRTCLRALLFTNIFHQLHTFFLQSPSKRYATQHDEITVLTFEQRHTFEIHFFAEINLEDKNSSFTK